MAVTYVRTCVIKKLTCSLAYFDKILMVNLSYHIVVKQNSGHTEGLYTYLYIKIKILL